MSTDDVNHPGHYVGHPSGIETIELIEHLACCPANVVKYLARFKLKGTPEKDLRKALWYIEREITRLEAQRQFDPEKLTAWTRGEPSGDISSAVLNVFLAQSSTDAAGPVYRLQIAAGAIKRVLAYRGFDG